MATYFVCILTFLHFHPAIRLSQFEILPKADAPPSAGKHKGRKTVSSTKIKSFLSSLSLGFKAFGNSKPECNFILKIGNLAFKSFHEFI